MALDKKIFSSSFNNIKRNLNLIRDVFNCAETKIDDSKRTQKKGGFKSSGLNANQVLNNFAKTPIEVIIEDSSKGLNGRRILAVKVGEHIHDVNSLLSSNDPVLKGLGNQIANQDRIHNKNDKYKDGKTKIGRGFNIDASGQVSVNIGGFFRKTVVPIGSVGSIVDIEKRVTTEIQKVKDAALLKIDLQDNPELAAKRMAENVKINAEISGELGKVITEVKSKNTNFLTPNLKNKFNNLISQVYKSITPNSVTKDTNKVSADLTKAVSGAELPKVKNPSYTWSKTTTSIEKSDSTATNVNNQTSVLEDKGRKLTEKEKIEQESERKLQQANDVLAAHQSLIQGEKNINVNRDLRDLEPKQALAQLAELRNKVRIDISSLNDLKESTDKVKDYGIISQENLQEIYQYIETKSNPEFNTKLENLYKSGLDALEKIYKAQLDDKSSPEDKIAKIKEALREVRTSSYNIQLALNHENLYLTKNIKETLKGLNEIILEKSDAICAEYNKQVEQISADKKNGVNLESEARFLNEVKGYFPKLKDSSDKIRNLQYFIETTGLDKILNEFPASDRVKIQNLITKHFEQGSLKNKNLCSSHDQRRDAHNSEQFLRKIIAPMLADETLTPEVKKLYLESCLEGDYEFTKNVLVAINKKEFNSKEYSNLNGFLHNFSQIGNQISNANNPEMQEVGQHLISAQASLISLKETIAPSLSVNTLNSVELSKSFIAFKESSIAQTIKNFDLLIVQVIYEESKISALTEINQQGFSAAERDSGKAASELIEARITEKFQNLVTNLNQQERDILKSIKLNEVGLNFQRQGDGGNIDITDMKTIEKLCNQGLSNSSEIKKILQKSNAVAASLGQNKNVKSMLEENLLKDNEEYLQNEFFDKALFKLSNDVTITSDTERLKWMESLANRDNDITTNQSFINSTNDSINLESSAISRSATIAGQKIGRVLSKISNIGTKSQITLANSINSSETEQIKVDRNKLGEYLKALKQGLEKRKILHDELTNAKQQYTKDTGVIPLSDEDKELYEKQKEINGSTKGKTSNRIINNYFLMKNEKESLESIKKDLFELSTPDPSFCEKHGLKMLDPQDVVEMMNSKILALGNLADSNLDGFYGGIKLVRVNAEGKITNDGKYTAIAANSFHNGARIDKVIGLVNLDGNNKDQILQRINVLSNNISSQIEIDASGKAPSFLRDLNGFNFDTLHRSDRSATMTLEKLNSLETPENAQKMQRIRNQAYLVDFADELKVIENPDILRKRFNGRENLDNLVTNGKLLNVWQKQDQDLSSFNDGLVKKSSGNLKEATLLIRMGIISSYNLEKKSNPHLSFTEFLREAQSMPEKSLKILENVGLKNELQPLCIYEVEKLALKSGKDRIDYLYECYEDVNLSTTLETKRTNEIASAKKENLERQEDILTKKINNMKAGSQLSISNSLDANITQVTSAASTAASIYMSSGLVDINHKVNIHNDSAFSIMKQRDGKVALIINREQGVDLGISFKLVADSISGGVGTGMSANQGIKFEFSGENAAKDAAAFARKLTEGKQIDVDDIAKASTTNLINGKSYDASSNMRVTSPSISGLLSIEINPATVNARNYKLDTDKDNTYYSLASKAIMQRKSSVTHNKNQCEHSSYQQDIFVLNVEGAATENAVDHLGVPIDLFYVQEKSVTTGIDSGFITHHTIENSILLDKQAMSSSNQSEYLHYLQELMANQGEQHLLYDKELLQEIEDVMRNHDGDKKLVITREIKPEILDVINIKTEKLHAGEIDQETYKKETNSLLSDERNTTITDISISCSNIEITQTSSLENAKSAALNTVRTERAVLEESETITIERLQEIKQDPETIAKLNEAKLKSERKSLQKNRSSDPTNLTTTKHNGNQTSARM